MYPCTPHAQPVQCCNLLYYQTHMQYHSTITANPAIAAKHLHTTLVHIQSRPICSKQQHNSSRPPITLPVRWCCSCCTHTQYNSTSATHPVLAARSLHTAVHTFEHPLSSAAITAAAHPSFFLSWMSPFQPAEPVLSGGSVSSPVKLWLTRFCTASPR